jgi:hypothetical protein
VTGRLLAQLAWIAARDADAALPDPYAWPPEPPTPEQLAESRRLNVLASRLFTKAREAGCVATAPDEVFGPTDDEKAPAAP